MLHSTTNHSVFYHHNSSRQCIYLVVYVDDIVITGSDCNTLKYTLVVFSMLRVFCRYNLKFNLNAKRENLRNPKTNKGKIVIF